MSNNRFPLSLAGIIASFLFILVVGSGYAMIRPTKGSIIDSATAQKMRFANK